MLGFYGWDADFSQSIHKLGLFHGWDAENDASVHESRLIYGLDGVQEKSSGFRLINPQLSESLKSYKSPR